MTHIFMRSATSATISVRRGWLFTLIFGAGADFYAYGDGRGSWWRYGRNDTDVMLSPALCGRLDRAARKYERQCERSGGAR